MDHSNGDIIYIATGDNRGGNGAGVYKSINGGSSWSATGFKHNLSDNVKFYNLTQNPDNPSILLAGTNQGIYRTTNGGKNWTKIKYGFTRDVKFNVSKGYFVYAIIYGKFHISTDAGISYKEIPNGPNVGSGKIAISKSDKNHILIWSSKGVWLSTNGGYNWSAKSNAIEKDKTIIFDAMAISPSNPNILYGGGIDMWRSDNGGDSWNKISMWHSNNNPATPEVHADHRMLAYNPLNNRVYSCNDGGIDRYDEAARTWTELNNNLQIPQYYSAASAETNGNIIGVGSQDNGGSMRKNDLSWINTNGGDAGTQAIDPTNANICYSNYNPNPEIIRTTNGWRSTQNLKPNEDVKSWWLIPFTLQPSNPQNIVVGYHAIYKSYDRGDNWSKISPDFAPRNNYWEAFRAIAVAPSDGNVIYAYRHGKFYYSYNNGTDWGQLSFTQDISDIAVDPTNSKIVYVTCSRYDENQKIYKSTDGGKNWSNISSGIPNIPVYSIVYQKESNEMLYVGTQLGVFYKDKNMDSWKVYGNGLPKTIVRDLHINYNKGKLRAATYGRGIYETEPAVTIPTNICIAPSGIKTSQITSTSFKVEWDPIDKAKQYYIYHGNDDIEWIKTEANKNTSIIISNLNPSTNYNVDVWVQCSNDESKSTRISVVTNPTNNIASGSVYQLLSTLPAERALDVARNIKDNEVNAILYDHDDTNDDQYWKFTEVANETYVITQQNDPNSALEVYQGLNVNGNNVIINNTNSSPSQQWKITIVGNQIYKLESVIAPELFLDVENGIDANQTNIQIWNGDNSDAQRWRLLKIDENLYTNSFTNIENKTKVFPNPSVEAFVIEFDNPTVYKDGLFIELINIHGAVVKKSKAKSFEISNSIRVTTNELATGLYILDIKSGSGEKIYAKQILIRR